MTAPTAVMRAQPGHQAWLLVSDRTIFMSARWIVNAGVVTAAVPGRPIAATTRAQPGIGAGQRVGAVTLIGDGIEVLRAVAAYAHAPASYPDWPSAMPTSCTPW